ncbi:MAG: ComEC/Rec2 family competence protein [Gemmatimonadaceae bacterium]
MPSIMWILVSVAGGFFAGFTISWQICLAVWGVLAWLAATDIVPSATVLYFAAACALAVAGPRPDRGFQASTRPDPTAIGERMRLRATRAIDRAFEADAPTARALLVADQSEIPRDVKRAYADAGIVHMLAISGLHVSIVAASLALVLNLLRVPGRLASFMTAGIITGYVFMLGFPAPALRAAVMVCIATAAHASQRHTSRWSILALGGIVPLMKPETVLAVGYQLSMAGMAAVIAAGALAKRGRLGKLRGWRRSLTQSLLVSGVATLVTAPLVARWFGRLSLIGPLTNLVADPVIAMLQPMLFLALILSPWPAAAHFVAAAAHPLLVAFASIAHTAAAVPFAAISISASPAAVVLSIIAAMAFVAACVSRFPGRAITVAVAALSLTIWTA